MERHCLPAGRRGCQFEISAQLFDSIPLGDSKGSHTTRLVCRFLCDVEVVVCPRCDASFLVRIEGGKPPPQFCGNRGIARGVPFGNPIHADPHGVRERFFD